MAKAKKDTSVEMEIPVGENEKRTRDESLSTESTEAAQPLNHGDFAEELVPPGYVVTPERVLTPKGYIKARCIRCGLPTTGTGKNGRIRRHRCQGHSFEGGDEFAGCSATFKSINWAREEPGGNRVDLTVAPLHGEQHAHNFDDGEE